MRTSVLRKILSLPNLIFAMTLATCAGVAWPASLEIFPAIQTVRLGQVTAMDIYLGDFGTASRPAASAFSMDINFDSSVLAFDHASFGIQLGNPGLGEALTNENAVTGLVSLAEISFLGDAELLALQSDRFLVATLFFTAIAPGSSPLSFVGLPGSSEPIVLDTQATAVSPLDLIPSTVAVVPEPMPALLLLPGIAAIWGMRTRHLSQVLPSSR